jgi:hypothetical protein
MELLNVTTYRVYQHMLTVRITAEEAGVEDMNKLTMAQYHQLTERAKREAAEAIRAQTGSLPLWTSNMLVVLHRVEHDRLGLTLMAREVLGVEK